ncbi:MAG: hypothetical protein JWQ71_3679 [Pedosphaera sp.]|nr:hypothetical protein [Pedosphaera sp.]
MHRIQKSVHEAGVIVSSLKTFGFQRGQASFMSVWVMGILGLAIFTLPAGKARATEYEVGPDKELAEINDVPWESIKAGDHVNILWRETPYKAKWVMFSRGTEAAPIIVHGVPAADGKLPVIDGNGASSRKALDYWGGERSIIKLGGSSRPAGTLPAYITIENLEIRSARPPNTYAGRGGKTTAYAGTAASIFIENGDHLTIRNCTLHDSANGLYASHNAREITIEGCWIYDNGLQNSGFDHNTYTEASGIIFQYNHYGALKKGSGGNNLKDRSSGCVIRYNWIEGGNRELDLVDAEGSESIRNDPRYRETFVYGNVLIEPAGDGNNQIVHYGGDSGKTDGYRKGTLYFFNNTVISKQEESTALFSLSTNDEHVDCRNNIIYVAGSGRSLAMLNKAGSMDLSNNWLKPGWVKSKEDDFTGTVNAPVHLIEGNSSSFVNEAKQDYHLAAGSSCIKAGSPLPTKIPAEHALLREYVAHQSSREIPNPSKGRDSLNIGAFQTAVK